MAIAIFLALFTGLGRADGPKLVILDSGVQSAEDAPFVSAGYKFLPGDSLHFSFSVAGYRTRPATQTDGPKVDLTYTVNVLDQKDVPLTEPLHGDVQAELNPEDKHWMPKRRVAFQLPAYVSAGTYRVVVQTTDRVSGEQASAEYPFKIGGSAVPTAATLAVQRFEFFRSEQDREPLELAAYRAGDSVVARFLMVGFKTDETHRYKLSYKVTVLRPDGRPYLRDATEAKLDGGSFYPAPYVPGELLLSTSASSAKGQYSLIITLHDQLAQTTQQFKTSFSLE